MCYFSYMLRFIDMKHVYEKRKSYPEGKGVVISLIEFVDPAINV